MACRREEKHRGILDSQFNSDSGSATFQHFQHTHHTFKIQTNIEDNCTTCGQDLDSVHTIQKVFTKKAIPFNRTHKVVLTPFNLWFSLLHDSCILAVVDFVCRLAVPLAYCEPLCIVYHK
jgi:hypothetical protein